MGVWLGAVYALAIARATGLITADTLTEPLRDGLIRRLGQGLPPHPGLAAMDLAMKIVSGGQPQPPSLPDIDYVLAQLRQAHPARWVLGKLATCAWCASIWISAAVVPLAWWHGDSLWLLLPALALAASQITGMLSDVGRG